MRVSYTQFLIVGESNISCSQEIWIMVVRNDQGELIPTHTPTGWRVCIDYKKLNAVTRKDHFSLPFIDQILEKLTVATCTNDHKVVIKFVQSNIFYRFGVPHAIISNNGSYFRNWKFDVHLRK